MKKIIAAAALSLSGAATGAEAIEVSRVGTKPTAQAPADYFTGRVRLDMPFSGTGGSRIGGATVTFEAGARSAWHTHPLGQLLIVTAGAGLVQEEGGPVEEIRAGDTVWIAPGVKHWHGAAPTTAMSHLAISETVDGSNVTWMEQVSDEQYPD